MLNFWENENNKIEEVDLDKLDTKLGDVKEDQFKTSDLKSPAPFEDKNDKETKMTDLKPKKINSMTDS